MGLITIGFFIVSPWLLIELLAGNSIPLSVLGGLLFLGIFFFVLQDKCWLAVPLCLPMTGSLNFLPVKFSPFELSVLLTLSYVVVQFVMTNRRSLCFGPAYLWVPLLLISLILLYHWFRGGNIGLSMFGGESSGGRRTFTILLGILAMPALLWFPSPGDKWLQRIPFLYLLGALLEFGPFLLTSAVPALAPYVFRIYSSVNFEMFSASTGIGAASEISRVGQLGPLAISIQIFLLSYFRPYEWLRPSRWIVPIVSILCLIATIYAGFRSYLFNFFVISFVSLIFGVRWNSLFLAPLGAALLTFLCVGQGSLFTLPITVQRTLSSLPGKWSSVAVQSAEGSDDFRDQIKKMYIAEFIGNSDLFGDGYKYDSRFMKDRAIAFLDPSQKGKDDVIRGFIIARDHHVGWIGVHHPIGWIGLALFVFFSCASIFYVCSQVLKRSRTQVTPLQIWSSALLIQIVLSFFVVYGNMQGFFAAVCSLLAISIRSFTLDKRDRDIESAGAPRSDRVVENPPPLPSLPA